MNSTAHMIRNTTSGSNKNHHRHESGTMNSKKGKSVIRVLTNLCRKKKKEVNIVPIPGKCGYQAELKGDIDPPLLLYKVLFEVDAKKGSHFVFYSHESSWSYANGPTINSLTSLIKQVEGIRV